MARLDLEIPSYTYFDTQAYPSNGSARFWLASIAAWGQSPLFPIIASQDAGSLASSPEQQYPVGPQCPGQAPAWLPHAT